ncbi:MAG TPA: hypothetical protein VGQ42_12195 [Candidatus Dormibacteraeota bacterium]|nr:hypothetical protein [Candidatus Dormibacteraeota bacterium]
MSAAVLRPYPVTPRGRAGRRMSDRGVRARAIAAVVVIAGIITVIAVLVRPVSLPCGSACGRPTDAVVQPPATYVNSAHGFAIDYPPDRLTIAVNQADVVEFHSGGGPISFSVVQAPSVDAAVSQAVNGLSTSTFQDLQVIGPVRGAEIGYVLGAGTAWSATYVPPGGGGASPVRIAVLAAQSGGLMVVATMFSSYDPDTAHVPYGLAADSLFDYPISNFHFPGSR